MHENIVKLGKIATVSLGYSLRVSPKNEENGNAFIIQPKDIDVFGSLSNKYTKIIIKNFRNCDFLKKEDILFSNRAKFVSTVFEQESYNTVASSGFFIIHVEKKKILPYYLAMYLNSKYGQKEISRQQNIGTVPSINKINFEEINIIVPNLEKQEKFVNLYKAYKKYQILSKRMNDLKENIMNNIFNIKIGE
jgi:restriction endonuclease S subunit